MCAWVVTFEIYGRPQLEPKDFNRMVKFTLAVTGTPINKGPSIGAKDLNLYRLFKVVQKIGGYNKVCFNNSMKCFILRKK